jgi:hypothetical protein
MKKSFKNLNHLIWREWAHIYICLSCRGYKLYFYVIGNGIIHLIPFTAALANAPCSSMHEGNAETHEVQVDFDFGPRQSTSHTLPVSGIWSIYILFDYKTENGNEEENGQRVKRKRDKKVHTEVLFPFHVRYPTVIYIYNIFFCLGRGLF